MDAFALAGYRLPRTPRWGAGAWGQPQPRTAAAVNIVSPQSSV